MTSHADEHRKEEKRAKPMPIEKRKRVRDCEIGDVMEFADGRVAVLTSWLARAPFGRAIADGVEGEIHELDPDASVTRLSGYR